MNTTSVAPTPPAPLSPPKLQAPRAPRASKRKLPAAKDGDASLQELIAEAARLHATVYVDDVSGTIHGPLKESGGKKLAVHAKESAKRARETQGFREAYADALAKSAPAESGLADTPDTHDAQAEVVRFQSSEAPLVPEKVEEKVGLVRRFSRSLAAVQSFAWDRFCAFGKHSGGINRWYQQKRLAQLKMKRLRVVETVSLGEKRFISVVQVDSAEFLVGGSASSIALLGELGSGLPAGARRRSAEQA